jgi:hypothetical protein
VTIDVTNSPSLSRRGTLSRSSSYSAYSATSAVSTGSKDPIDRVRTYSAITTDSVFVSPTFLGAPVYSPPPNTPATFEPIHQIHDYSTLPNFDSEMDMDIKDTIQLGNEPKENADHFNPFSFTGPTQYPNHSSQAPIQPSNGFQGFASQPNIPSHGTSFQSSGSSIVDLEKARGLRQQNQPQKKRYCGRQVLICLIVTISLIVLIVVVVVVVLRTRQNHKHTKRMACMDVPGMYIDGEWKKAYNKCS